MKLTLILLLNLLLNQNDVLVQQFGATVPVSDVDSYFNDIPPDIRADISYDPMKLEKNIIGILNMNIIYDYIQQKGMIDHAPFQQVINEVKNQTLTIDETVYQQLDISKDQFISNYRHYLTKKNLYSTLQDYLYQRIDDDKATKLARDRFLVNRNQYRKPEKRDIGMIRLSVTDYEESDVLDIVKLLMSNDTAAHFSELAADLSTDQTIKYNDGLLGEFHQSGFRYPFADQVFSATIGVVPSVFKKDDEWYIIRINDIIPGKTARFSDYQDILVNKIKMEMMERQFQAIINQYAKHDIEVNEKLVDDLFRRYEVFQ